MRCPACLHDDTKVLDSRDMDEGMATRRRRECPKCTFRFSTKEQVEILNLTVIKRDGRTEPYSTDKIVRGLHIALEKRLKNEEKFKKLVSGIERDIQIAAKDDTIESKVIGTIVMRHLKKIDKIAYIRFASVYQDFEDLLAFQEEVEKLLSNRKKK
ncbi:MAG: Transcriptional repressor nrdR [uncultured bacterium]|nr:MAG: Transcriptional repressor nrdR [uncultured bacterium]HBY74196.1 transcriptional regulator NrdR [Candidatus Kerfeldbacteria bacterium]